MTSDIMLTPVIPSLQSRWQTYSPPPRISLCPFVGVLLSFFFLGGGGSPDCFNFGKSVNSMEPFPRGGRRHFPHNFWDFMSFLKPIHPSVDPPITVHRPQINDPRIEPNITGSNLILIPSGLGLSFISLVCIFFPPIAIEHLYNPERLAIVLTERWFHLKEYLVLRKENIFKDTVVLLSVTIHCPGLQVCDTTMRSTEIATLLLLRSCVCLSS